MQFRALFLSVNWYKEISQGVCQSKSVSKQIKNEASLKERLCEDTISELLVARKINCDILDNKEVVRRVIQHVSYDPFVVICFM